MQELIEAHFAKPGRWHAEILALRAIAKSAGLVEEWKWHSPVYTHDGHNVAIIWGFSDRAAIGFFKGVLLDDPQGILTVPGAKSRTSRVVNFTDTGRIDALAPTLRAYLAEAMDKAAIRIDLPQDDLDYPQELTDRIDADPEFSTAFDALTPGRRRGWVLHFSGAKQSATRQSRIDKAAPKILQGKGMQDR